MNPANPFGSPHGGAFQAPSSSAKPTLFPTFGSQNSSSHGQSSSFFQPPAFGQPPSMNQPTAQSSSIFGQSIIRQNLAFGQTGGQTQTSAFGQTGGLTQTSAFGQTGGQIQNSAFGQTGGQSQTPSFGQTSGQNQTPAFGQTSAQNQTPAFGQTGGQNPTSAFGKTTGKTQTSIFGLSGGQTQISIFGQTGGQNQTSIFGQTQTPSFGQTGGQNQTPSFGQTGGQNQTPSFGQTGGQTQTPAFGQTQTPSFGQTGGQTQTPAFGQTGGQTQTPAFGQTGGQTQTPAFGQTGGQTPAFGQTGGQNQTPSFGQTGGQTQTSAFGQTGGQNQTPSFGQTGGQTQTSAFGQTGGQTQTSAFGQTGGQTQTSAFGQTGGQTQTSAFGQTGGQTQTSAFGQTGGQTQTSAFGQTGGQSQTSAFGQTGGQTQTSAFGQTGGQTQTSAFGQPSAFGQAPGFGKPPPAYGSSKTTVSSTGGFGQPSSTGVFGGAQNVTQSRTAGSSAFCFKPANEALFKPIFSASSEPANPQVTTKSSLSFSGGVQTSLSTTSFPLLAGTKPGPLDFTFSQPAAAASISAPANQPAAASSSGSADTIQFTVSQPAASSSSSTSASTTEPTTPSFFSFTTKTLQTQPTFLSGGAGFSQPPAFGGNKGKAESSKDEKGSNTVGLEDTNVFARLGKPVKRKDDPAALSSGLEKPAAEESVPAEADSPRHPSKRPLIRSRGLPGGLFSRALTSIRKERANTGRRDISKEIQKPVLDVEGAEEAEGDEPFATPPSAPTTSRDVMENPEGSGVTPSLESSVSTPVSRGSRRDSLDSLSGMSPSDLTSIMCRNVPHALNKKDVIEKHFSRFGKVRKVFCRPAKNMSIVHFDDHAAAAKAKKKGKILHRHELLLLWQKKKQSPGEKGSRSAGGNEEAVQSQEVTESRSAGSPLKRPTLMPPKLSSSVTISRSSPVMKPSPVKVLQFDTEPQKENITEPQSTERPVPSSLIHLIGQVTETAEEKYRLLEQRDKILRQGRPKRTDLDMSKVFVGTCPDMCPEKERYMRETRNQLSVFEVIPNTEMVDHAAAIKEYSRSSADQEEPLPHELRPLPVLSMTMDYLVTQIMDQVQDNHRDWYDFVWNRTRGIRKDITQQRLCCPNTVSLIEKCTRFHVHCAHHLCEEPMSSFDTKINNENMTKCLQSLKEMYEDLAAQHVSCPREAEFRQYSVLLKLNEGDILREVQQFRDGVRNSPEVKFAVQAFTAVNSNNFVRFFKLVKGASYLSSCLLHRYFNQVRAKALKTLNMAHTVGPRSTPFPVEDVVRMLMFRNTAEATDFILQYGLNVNDGMVELSRTAFQEPELPLSLKKSEVILAKKTVLIGQVVNGGPLPNPPQHIPVCSFDSQNKYRGDGRLAEPAVKADGGEVPAPPAFDPSAQFVPIKPPELPPVVPDETGGSYHPAAQLLQPEPVKPPSPPPKPEPVYSDEDVVAELDSVIEEVVEAEVKDVANAGASYAAAALSESSAQVESLVKEVLGQMLQEISSSEIKLERERVAEEKRKLEEARRKQEHEAFLAQFSCSLCTEVVHDVLDETIKEIAASEIQEALNEKAERLANCTEQICCSLVEETLSTEISLLVEDVLETELERIHKYIKRWRDVVAVRRQLKRQMRGFPAAPCCVDPRFKLKALAPSAPARASVEDLTRGLVNLGNAGLLAVSSTRLLRMREEVLHRMRVHFYYQQLLEETVWAPLDLPALVTENIPDPPERIFWKALLLLPSDHESVASLADRVLSDWLEVKLGGDVESEDQLDGTMKTLCVTNTLQENGQRTHKVHIAVKASRAPLTEPSLSKVEDLSELQGTGALIMLLPAQSIIESGQEDQDVPLLSALLQLKQLQQVNAWHCPLPLVVLVPGCENDADTQKLAEALSLQTLMEEDFISECTFFFIPETTSDLQGSKQLIQALRWLLARAPPPLLLSCQTLVQLVEASLSREFSPRVYANRQDRAAARLPPQDPGPVVQLYNAVLDHVADKVDSPGLCGLSWPPAEFSLPETRDFVPYLGWNSELHLTWLRDAILSLKLPKWEELPATDSWLDLCSSIFSYAAKIPMSHRSQPLLVSRLENLLEQVKVKAQHIKTTRSKRISGIPDDELQDVCPAFSQIPWDDVLVVFIDHKLKDWQLPGPPVCKDAVMEDGEILVYFPAGSLDGFQPPEAWTQAVEHTHRAKQQDRDGETDASSAPSARPSLRQRLFHSLVEPIKASTPPLDITHTPTAEELQAYKVLQSLEEEKAESQRNMEQLQRLLDGDPLDHFSTPLFIPSSTLLFTPTVVKCPPADRTREVASTQMLEPDERWDRAAWSKTPPVSLTRRLKDLERQILASREEERTCRLKLTGLLSIVDD